MPLSADDFDPLAKRAAPKSEGRDSATSVPLTPARGLDASTFNPTAAREPPQATPATSGEWLQSLGLGAAALAGGGAMARVPGIASHAGAAYRGVPGDAGRALRAPQAIFAPSSISKEARGAEALIREKTGEGARETARATDPLVGQPKPSKIYDPRTWVQRSPWADIGSKPVTEQLDFIKYVEGRSPGAKLADQRLQSLADKGRDAFASVYTRMKKLQAEGKEWARFGFIENYYAHMWEKDAKHAELFSSPGGAMNPANSRFTKQRKIPTIEEGMALGLKPRTTDPVQTVLEYVNNANRFITNVDILETAYNNKMIMRTNTPKDVPPGWIELQGNLAKRGLQKFYAPEGFAKVYNNYMGRGFEGEYRDAYKATQHTFNMLTAAELGLSGFHAGLMGFEGSVSEMARGIEHIFHGELGKAANAVGMSPFAGLHLARTGSKVEQSWLGRTPGTQRMREVVELMTKAGGRGAGIEHTAGEYRFTSAGSFWEAFRRGSLKAERAADIADIKGNPLFGPMRVFAKNIGRVIESTAEPLFKYYVPKIKNGAFYETMSSWLDRNPEADISQKTAAAREIWDSIDNRFGQVVQDNIFWNKALKQVSMLAMRSYSWNLGTVREIGGGVKDMSKLFTGDRFAPRAYYVVALPIVYGFMSALYQVLKTGTAPQDLQDYMAPKTGGVDAASGKPERRNVYGYMKDVYGWSEHPVQEAGAKLGGAAHLAGQLATGKDAFGRPIAGPDAHGAELVEAYLRHVVEAFTPFSGRALTERKKGSNIGTAERLGLGFQPAGQQWTAPERYKAMKLKRERQEWKAKQRQEKRKASYLE